MENINTYLELVSPDVMAIIEFEHCKIHLNTFSSLYVVYIIKYLLYVNVVSPNVYLLALNIHFNHLTFPLIKYKNTEILSKYFPICLIEFCCKNIFIFFRPLFICRTIDFFLFFAFFFSAW